MQINVLPVDASSFRLIIEVSVQFSPAEKNTNIEQLSTIFGAKPGHRYSKYGTNIDYYKQIQVCILFLRDLHCRVFIDFIVSFLA